MTTNQWIAGLLLSIGAASAQAALIPVNEGKLVEDTDNNTLWISDGNVFRTLANRDGDPSGFVQAVIDASHGVIHDTPNEFDTPANSGVYLLTSDDLHPDVGSMTWYGAHAFVNYLNSVKYLGYADWRLPVTQDIYAGPAPVGTQPGDAAPCAGELAQLFFTELGGTSNSTGYVGTLNANAALFQNLQEAYHYGTEGLALGPDHAWALNSGVVYDTAKLGPKGTHWTLPVRSGQVSIKSQVAALTVQVKEGGGRLEKASSYLHDACVELNRFEDESSTSRGEIKDATLKLDVKAVAVAMGCT